MEISVPFQVSALGGVATSDDPGKNMGDHLMSIVGTEPGERVMRGDYGVPLRSHVFDQLDNTLRTLVTSRIQEQIGQWEPGVVYRAASFVPDPTDGTVLGVRVAYSVTGSADSAVGTVFIDSGAA